MRLPIRIWSPPFENSPRTLPLYAIQFATLGNRFAGIEPQWFQERVAETHVGEQPFFRLDQESEMVELRPRLKAAKHACGQAHDAKAKLLQEPGKQPIKFVAETSTPASNDLGVERREGEGNWVAQRDIEILKGDGKHMRPMELPQRLGCRRTRACVPNALEIGVYLH